MNLIQLKKATALSFVALWLICFGLSPIAQAQLPSPTPDGGYPNGNTAEGDNALFSLTTGFGNTATGNQALFANTTGFANTATGDFALSSNTDGQFNTATGAFALVFNTIGFGNTATGFDALENNTIGFFNTATGDSALFFNTTGNDNTANGTAALFANTIGFGNTATGFNALVLNTTGNDNTANGFNALVNNTIGGNNIALGVSAGLNLTTGDNNIDIGNEGVAGEANTIRIGTQGTQTATFIAGINATPVTGVPVKANAAGQLGTPPSAARFKDAIKPMDKASEAILALKPVTFRYKKELDPKGSPQFGLVAEEVEKVNPDLITRDRDGKPYTVRYDAVNAMLLNEFLKEHRRVEQLTKHFQVAIAQQRKEIAALTATVKEQAAQIQRVSAQLELSKAAPQTVLNNQ
jgi:hypothetical protein